MITFLLDTKLGHLALGLICIALAGAGCYWKGHNAGWDSGVRSAQKIVNAQNSTIMKLEAVIESDTITIKQLRTANEQWASAAQGDAAKLSQAAAQLKQAQDANAKALASAQTNLRKAETEHGDAHAWSVAAVPASVLDALGLRQADHSP